MASRLPLVSTLAALCVLGSSGCRRSFYDVVVGLRADSGGCPAAFAVGERCASERLVCPYPGSCGTMCECRNQPGGFVWQCAITQCRCTCYCGRIAISSCETLGCAKQEDPCPAVAKPFCDDICVDSRVPDARPRDARGELRRDAAPDAKPDLRRDLAIPDRKPDAPPDQRPPDKTILDKSPLDLGAVDQPRDQAPDAPADQ
jgi:hypothetical protein